MPRRHTDLYLRTLGSRFAEFRTLHGLRQVDAAAELGVTQSYLSRVERGERVPSLGVADRMAALLGDPPSGKAQVDETDADEEYDRIMLAMGRGDADTAEALIIQLLNAEVDRPTRSANFSNRLRIHLASIRRDRGDLDGEEGALALYGESLQFLLVTGRSASAREVLLLTGACFEMKNEHSNARRNYQLSLEIATHQQNPQGVVRASNRLGVVATKTGDYERAEQLLVAAHQGALGLDSPWPYSFVSEKLGILRIRQGKYDLAFELLAKARCEIGSQEPLRLIQNMCAIADLLASSGEVGGAQRELKAARAMATAGRFFHQLEGLELVERRIVERRVS